MAVTIEVYEHTGVGPTNEQVTNSNWKSTGGEDSVYKYWFYPLRRPTSPTLFTISYNKYLYAKIIVNASAPNNQTTGIARIRWVPNGVPGIETRVYYGLFNTYTQPINTLDGRLTLLENDTSCIAPRVGSGGPSSATTYQNSITTTPGVPVTYYTEYLVTQMVVERDTGQLRIGNTSGITWQLQLDEYHQ